MASKSYTLLEYLVTIEMELKKLKKIVAESVGADYSELIAQINGIGQELNSFKTSITNTVDNNNTNLLSKFNSLESQFITFKTSITNTVNSNKSEITSQVNTLTTNFNSFKTSLESQVSGLTTRVTSVENRVTTLENNGGITGGTVDLTEVNNRISTNENNIKTLQTDVTSLKSRVSSLENNTGSSGGSDGGSSTQTSGKKLIASYTHSSNPVYQPTAFDSTTGQFTCPNHGLTGNEKLMINFDRNTYTDIRVIPYELFLKINSTIWVYFKPVVVDENTFTLDSYTYDTDKNSNVDVSKFWFETVGVDKITLNNLNLNGVKELEIITYDMKTNEFGLCLDCLNNTIQSPHRLSAEKINKIDLIPFSVEHTFTQRGLNIGIMTKTIIRKGISETTVNKIYIGLEAGKYTQNWNTSIGHYGFSQYIDGELSFKDTFTIDVATRANIRNGFTIQIYDTGVR